VPTHISDIAQRTGVSPDTIRHYERVGLLVDIQRTAGGFRVYGESAVKRVLLIRRALAFGFSLRELHGFLRARDRGMPPCREVRSAAAKKLEVIEEQLRNLRALRSAMRRALAEWDEKLEGAGPGEALHLLENLPSVRSSTRQVTIQRGAQHATHATSRRSRQPRPAASGSPCRTPELSRP
jgi:DNA-binding transcriptional MerR regulator